MSISSEKRQQVSFTLKNVTKSPKKVAQICRVSESTVYRVMRAIKVKGNVERKSGSGRKRKLSNDDRRILGRIAQNNGRISVKKLTTRFNQLTNKVISPSTINRNLIELGYTMKTPKIKPLLNERHKLQRLAFCNENLGRNWNNVVFSDEATFQLSSNSKKVRSKRQVVKQSPKFIPKVMVWGSISARGKSVLKICDSNVNSDTYINIIDECLAPTMDVLYPDGFLFQQDNAPAHKAKKTSKFFEDNGIQVLDWPANSPDLNPIENLWALMKHELSCKIIKSKSELIGNLYQIWNEIPQETVTSLINSMPNRIKECLDAEGGHTKY